MASKGPEKRREARGEGERAKKLRRIVSSSSSDDGQEHIVLSPTFVDQKPSLRNWKRWSGVKEELRLKRLVEAKPPSLILHRLESLLLDDARDDQQWTIEQVEEVEQESLPKAAFNNPDNMTSNYYRFDLRDNLASKQINKPKRQAWIPVDCMPVPGKPFARKVGDEFCRLLNHLPLATPPVRPGDVTAQLLGLEAVHRANDKRNDIASLITKDLMSMRAFTAFNVAYEASRNAYLARLLTYDETLGPHQQENTRFRIQVDDVTLHRDVPEIPEVLIPLLPAVTNRGSAYANLSAEDQAQHDKAVKLCRYVQYVMFGACGKKDDLFTQAHSIAGLYKQTKDAREAGNIKNLSSLYDGQQLYGTLRRPEMVKIRPSIRAGKDIKGPHMPEIHVIGHSKARVSTVLERGTQEFLSGSDYLKSFEAAVEKADAVNIMPSGISLTLSCDHTPAQRVTQVHVCQNCNGIAFCGDLVFSGSSDLRVCSECAAKEQKSEVRSYGKGHRMLKGSRFRDKVLQVLKRDMLGNAEDTKAERQSVAAKLAEKWLDEDDDTWEDQFFDKRRPDSMAGSSATRSSAFLASPDAATPFHIENAFSSYHHIDNIVPTASYANMGTNTWLKGNLHAIKEAQGLPKTADMSSFRQINNRLDHLWAIRSRFPHSRKARLKIKMEDAQFQQCLQEWKTGVLAKPGEKVPYAILYKSISNPTWSSQDRKRFDDLISQMQEHHNVQIELPRGKSDNAPFPWRAEHMPEDWSWARLEAHMAYHYDLMYYWCDRYFTTDEDSETLFLELMWQYMENNGRSAWLGIPLTLFNHHAAGWAIGHLHHGQPMRTRFLVGEKPTNISQRDDSRCNVLIEPRIANYMKMDYPEEEYDTILQDLQSMKGGTPWFEKPKSDVPQIDVYESRQDAFVRSKCFCKAADEEDEEDDFNIVEADDVESDYDEEELTNFPEDED
ncbi:hypothetical protein KC357_g3059 [Hortaea werneckii]|nr:hypothetical protein KC357_g3059 [Hortaea werneckii]